MGSKGQFASGSITPLFLVAISVLGCSSAPFHTTETGASGHLAGTVHGGQQPVTGSTIQLYAVGTAGDRSAATPLLSIPVTTDQNGNFSITSDYTCQNSFNDEVYVVATGGNPGLVSGTNNNAIAMMAAVGTCQNLTSSTFIAINELTTVGSLAAVFPYASSYANLGSGPADSGAFYSAFKAVSEYTNTSTGTVPGPSLPAGVYASSTEIDTLADILSTCINSAGGVASDGTPCGALFALTKPAAGIAPTDTIGAVINILNNPTANVSALFGLSPGAAPFEPVLSAPPSDWTLPLIDIPFPPFFSLLGGTYFSAQTLNIASGQTGVTIYYTLDGSIPTTSSSLYTGALHISTSETVNAIASYEGRVSGPVTSASFVINPFPTSLTVVSGSPQTAQIGTPFATPVKLMVSGAGGLPDVGASISFFTLNLTAANATLSSSTCITDSTGTCSIMLTANQVAGTYTIGATFQSFEIFLSLTNTPAPPVPHKYLVTVNSDTTSGVASNCADQNSNSSSANASCSLRDALAAAAANSPGTTPATILFAQTSPTTITLVNGSLTLPAYTTLQGATSGSGPTLTNLITVNGNLLSQVFTVAAGASQVVLNNLVITGGNANGSSYASVGGGIYTAGTLSVNNSTFVNNQATASGGAISNNGGTVSVFGSTFLNNQAGAGYGGAIDNFGSGTTTVSNSTFVGNQAPYGGALYSSGTTTILDSSIVQNSATYGAGIYNKGTMSVTGSIVSNNSGEDCGGLYCSSLWKYVVFAPVGTQVVDSSTITISFSDNLGNSFSQSVEYGQFSSAASVASGFGVYFSENYSGLDTTSVGAESFGNVLAITPIPNDTLGTIVVTNPGKSFLGTPTTFPYLLSTGSNIYGLTAAQLKLSALGDNGGPTQTLVPLAGSPALCAITPSSATGTDQRGQPRTATAGGSTCQDAGAVQTSN